MYSLLVHLPRAFTSSSEAPPAAAAVAAPMLKLCPEIPDSGIPLSTSAFRTSTTKSRLVRLPPPPSVKKGGSWPRPSAHHELQHRPHWADVPVGPVQGHRGSHSQSVCLGLLYPDSDPDRALGHGVRGGLGQRGAEDWDSEVPLGRAENGSDQGRHEGTRLEYHGQVGPVEKGLGSDGGRGR